ncbi:MAG: GNAT family N-acetyltransferase [Erysipelotrichaceae bacterium]
MLYHEEKINYRNHTITFRSAVDEDASLLVDYLKKVSAETPFLLSEPEEINLTLEDEYRFIHKYNTGDSSLLLMAFVDDEYAGNCSFSGYSRMREKHRADIGIALYQKFTGFGLGQLMLERLISVMRESGFEQAELTVVSTNQRARRLYEKLGFTECGRIPNANKYKDGTYSDNILMVLNMKKTT